MSTRKNQGGSGLWGPEMCRPPFDDGQQTHRERVEAALGHWLSRRLTLGVMDGAYDVRKTEAD